MPQYPNKGWALFGRARPLAPDGRSDEAKKVEAQIQAVWAKADVTIDAFGLCQSGRQ